MASGGNTLAEPRRREKQARGAVVANINSTDANDRKNQQKKKDEGGDGGKKKKKKGKKKSGAGDGSDDGGYQSSGGEHSFGTSKLTARSYTAGNHSGTRGRDTMQEDVMAQILRDYHDQPNTMKAEVAVKPFRWPLFGLRRMFGWAHVELHEAVLDGKIEIVKATLLRYMRKHPRRINEYDEEGRTALSLALMEDREDIADLIISVEETDVNKVDVSTGHSPLHCAVLVELESSAQKMAFRGANVNAGDKVGMTPLMLACRLGNESMVEMLVGVFGAELDPQDKAGWTCLFYAVFHNEVSITGFLLESGANPEHRDKKDMKAIDWGDYMDFGHVCALFEQFKAKLT